MDIVEGVLGAMKGLGLRVRWKEGQLWVKSEGMARAGRGRDKLEGRVKDEIEGREDRKKVSTWWMG